MGGHEFRAGDRAGETDLSLPPKAVDRFLWIGRSPRRSSVNLAGGEIDKELRLLAVSVNGGHLDGDQSVRADAVAEDHNWKSFCNPGFDVCMSTLFGRLHGRKEPGRWGKRTACAGT